MFDAYVRPWIDPPLDAIADRLAQANVSANAVTGAGLAIGLGGAAAVASNFYLTGLALFATNRLLDGLDGAIARRTKPTDAGGFLDITADFFIYAAYPLAFACADPTGNALAAAALLASFIASGSTFLAFAAVAAKRGHTTTAQGHKSIYYLAGLAEGTETIIAFALMCLWPAHFAIIATGFACLCVVSAVARLYAGMKALR